MAPRLICFSQNHPKLRHAVWWPQQEVNRPKARFKPTSPKKSGVYGGAKQVPTYLCFTCTPHGDLVSAYLVLSLFRKTIPNSFSHQKKFWKICYLFSEQLNAKECKREFLMLWRQRSHCFHRTICTGDFRVCDFTTNAILDSVIRNGFNTECTSSTRWASF